ncbi:receptor-like protein 54 [Rhodamnia argentea]|uniref:Receptor-like protein 54 n=1 Tax=Rhodamnia argentea TaxID=178133 RepID=A0A8B8PXY3_9MYRT|nr:receptor-like protein 54 [Rhodamnia argentea]
MEKESFHLSYMILLLTLVASHSHASTQPLCHEDERSALLEFKATTFIRNRPCCYDPTPVEQAKTESWSTSIGQTKSNCCSWAGVECDKVSGHVIGLDLSCSCLSGKINSATSIFRLLRLRSLSLAWNDFSCQIPPVIGNLGSLSHLDLSGSNFIGPIPHSLGNLTQLAHLDLSYNLLIGTTLPIGNLTLLNHLDLSHNYLNGTIPSSFGNIRELEHLSLLYNQFEGEIPSSFGRLGHLKHLDLGLNSLTGEVPSFLGNLVKYLNLRDNMLIGQIPSSLGNLTQLTFLDLRINRLTGEIPSFIGNLVRLTDIDLGYNLLAGGIPLSFQNLLELGVFRLRSNQLSGEIPSWLGRLTQLVDVDLSFNQFHGAIPSTISQLRNLNSLYLNSNNLSGTVNLDTLSEAKNLGELVLSSNKLSLTVGTNITHRYVSLGLGSCNLNGFPEFLRDQDDLLLLDLSYNNISGQVPEWFLDVSIENLLQLNLSGNFLTSLAQDPVIFKWKELYVADLRFNELQGSVPIPPPKIGYYFISNNRLSGGISPLMCNLSSIRMIDLSYNNMAGFLPQCLSNLSGTLEVMSLHRNNFIGNIPQLNGNVCALTMIDLSYNQLRGPLPRSLQTCKALEFLNFGNNQIRDIFLSWLGSLLSLKVLILQSNRFHGLIGEPGDGIEFPTLEIIDLSHNMFFGSLPSGYFKHWTAMRVSETYPSSYIGDRILPKWTFLSDPTFYYTMSVIAKGIQTNYSKIQEYLTLIDLSSNSFSGAIPETIGSLKQLELLNLSSNMLSGLLPPFLANLANLEALDLSRNRLSGEIPQELLQLTSLEVFDVSYNRLTGPIPQSQQFATFENNSYKGNSWLCGTPLSRKCRDLKASPPSSPASEDVQDSGSSMELDWKIVCMGYASGLVIGVVLGNSLVTRRRAQRLVKNFSRRKQRGRR